MNRDMIKEGIVNIYKEGNKRMLDARDLYGCLNIGRDFPTWIRAKIKSANLIANEDYITTVVNKSSVGRPVINYDLTVEAAIKIVTGMRINDTTIRIIEYLSSVGSIESNATNTKKTKSRSRKEIRSKKTSTVKTIKLENKPSNVIIKENNIFGVVRFVIINHKEYAVAKDVAKALGYSNYRDAISRHCKGVVKHDLLSNGGKQSMMIIPEGDIYRLITGSRLPEAEKFESWVFDDVLPSVRRYGFYATEETVEKLLNNPDAAIKIFESYKKEKQEKEALLKEKVDNAPKLMAYEDFINSDGLYSFSATAKIVAIPRTATSKTIIGRNTLLAWLRRDGVLISNGEDRNTPYQRYISQGIFEVKPIDEDNESSRITVKVTPKGVEWLYKKYRYSNMPKKFEVSNIEDYDVEDSNDIEYLDTAM